MSIVSAGSADPATGLAIEPVPRERRNSRAFVVWGWASYLLVTCGLVARSLKTSDGTLIYLIDDPAIHLSIARTFAESGTWGVVPGEFQSASSAPLWTLALSAVYLLVPSVGSAAPLLFNVAASLGLIAVLGRAQSVLVPSRDRLLDGPVTAALVVVALFLPALTLLGMEHILHMLLVVAVVALWTGAISGVGGIGATPLAAVLLALATLVRFETAFVAAALAVASLIPMDSAERLRPDRHRLARATLPLLAAGAPLAVFALVNRSMGQGWLPNSVLAKGQVINQAEYSSVSPLAVLNRLTTDPLLSALTIAALVAAVLGWRRRAFVAVSLVAAITTVLHASMASIGWFDRYQAYLIALGVLALLRVGSELRTDSGWDTATKHVSKASLVGLSLLVLVATKGSLTAKVTDGVADTYLQRYQAALFLDRYYDGRSVATGELGYISLLHDGPVTDLLGLGDFEVLEIRRGNDQATPPEQWAELAEQRGIEVVAVYPFTLWDETPAEWIHVGSWVLEGPTVTAYQSEFQFWATDPKEVAPLQAHLREFESQLPKGTHLELNDLATYRAGEQQRG